MGKYRFNVVRNIGNTHQIVKLRRVMEKIEKKLDKAFKILDNDTK